MENCSFETFSGGSWRSHDCLRYTQSAFGLCEAGSSRALPFTACCWRLNSLLPALRKFKKRSKSCTFFVGRGGVQGSAKPLHVPLTNTKGAICWNVTFLRGERKNRSHRWGTRSWIFLFFLLLSTSDTNHYSNLTERGIKGIRKMELPPPYDCLVLPGGLFRAESFSSLTFWCFQCFIWDYM